MFRLDRLNYWTVAVMIVYSYLFFGLMQSSNATNALLSLGLSAVLYLITIYLYFGIAKMAFENQNNLLWIGGIIAVVLGYLASGLSNLYLLLSGWSMLLFGGALIGRLTFRNRSATFVYIAGTLAVIVFAIAYYWPLLPILTEGLTKYSANAMESLRQVLLTSGYGADAVEKSLENTQQMMSFLIRIIPALSVLGSVMQFSIGYLLFLLVLDKHGSTPKRLKPFYLWKMPFWIMPMAIIAMILKLVGGESLMSIGENILVFLIVYYAITGLALVEFYLKKFNFSLFFKIMFYLFLFLTQLVGFFVAALLGFIDSFTDWRKVQSLSFENE